MDTLLFFRSLIRAQKRGEAAGICSVCSAHPLVLEAAMERAAMLDRPLLLEATANQINQFGGYMGMTPAEFRDMAYDACERAGLSKELLILGGDHLGPLTWSGEEEAEAMPKAEDLIRSFASAGFSKIHIDTSMYLADDDQNAPLSVDVVARRAAALCKAAEQAALEPPVYVIGSEVPPPGGATENEDSVAVTTVESLRETLDRFKEVFIGQGLEDAWERVIAVVVQPGVEFSDSNVILYDRAKAAELTRYVRSMDSIVLEGHSTDYQPAEKLTEMKEDGVAILKVGPALTFALREGLFELEDIERETCLSEPEGGYSLFADTLDAAMLENPGYWIRHYHGSEDEIAQKRKYSLSDRCRYYLTDARVASAIQRLRDNLSREKVDSYAKVKVCEVLDTYDL